MTSARRCVERRRRPSNRQQDDKDAFLAAAGLVVIGDKYLDGYATAELLGVTMPEPDDTERG
ncbi:hypothetical protein [Amycolatopsis keratiniphila]|uniref:Uncharacterized protein n=1 Tax=Amycolatopsis keratiniphila subsp. keratiniphila TaxID=227715 RepID=A0A1W2M1F3_9PSEU|nr:hypothetical protein [Amycolatopsis keratiniphila]ONF73684.1 hypothetical protein AVR91_0206135 [Amycolatopsis keratiniphila subsp. keratiniphila]